MDKQANRLRAMIDAAKAFKGGLSSPAGALVPFGQKTRTAFQAGANFSPHYRAAREAYMPFHNVGAEALRRTGRHIGANPFGYTAATGAGGYLLGSSGGNDLPQGHYHGDGHNHGQAGGQQYLNEQQLNQLLQAYNKGQG